METMGRTAKRTPRRADPPAYHEKLTFIEGIRGLVALYVVLGHFASMSDPNVPLGKPSLSPDWLQAAMAPLWFGHLAVAAFIVLSGFCLQTSLFSSNDPKLRNAKRFFKRRARRILPAYYACLAISIWVAIHVTPLGNGPPFNEYLPVTQENVLAHVALIHNLSPDWMYKINGVLWSIAVEVQLYFLFPLLVRTMSKIGRFLAIAICGGIAWVVLDRYAPAAKLYVWYFPLFACGMAASSAAYRPNLKLGVLPGVGAFFALIGIVSCGIWSVRTATTVQGLIVGDLLVGVSIACLCYAGATRPTGRIPKFFAWKPFAILGGFSYSLYLMHHPIQQALYIYRPVWIQGSVLGLGYLLVVGLPVILLGSWLFSLVFELPFMVSRSGKKRRRKPSSQPLQPAYALVESDADYAFRKE